VAGQTHDCQSVFSFTEPFEVLPRTFLFGRGTETSEDAGIDRTPEEDGGTTGRQRGNTVSTGCTVTLLATPLAEWTFHHWSNEDRDCDDVVILMHQAHRRTATFARPV
jgi:hypothetical protein